MNTQYLSRSPAIKRQPGFALIATISVMVLLVMIALAMLSLSTIELRQSRHNVYQQEARANARMALMIALGELQKNAGPDQRVTANSSVLDNSAGQQHLLGVWKSIGDGITSPSDLNALATAYKGSYSDKKRGDRFLRWLISGEASDVNEINFPQTAAATGAVDLVGAQTLGLDASATPTPEQRAKFVSAKLVTMVNSSHPSQSSGGYAWMISGENLKARVDFDHVEPSNASESIVDRGASPANNLHSLKPGNIPGAPDLSDKFIDADGKPSPSLSKSVSWRTLSLAASPSVLASDLGYYYHDLSTSSQGLLTNSKWGGLRKDLSLLAEQTALPVGMELSADPTAHIFDEGPFWQDMRTYMRSYKSFSDGGLVEWSGNSPHYTLGPNWLEAAQRRGWQHRMPVVSKWLWVISYFGKPDPQDANKTQLCMVVQPIIEMWNPFNLPLQMPSDSHFDLKFWNCPTNLFVKVVGGGTPLRDRGIFYPVRENEETGGYDRSAATARYSINFKDPSGNSVAMQPGEVVLFSDGSSSPSLPAGSKVIPLSKGLEIRGGIYSSNIAHSGRKLSLPSSSAIEVHYGPRHRNNELFYIDNYFVGPNGYYGSPRNWAYHSDIRTWKSMDTTASLFEPNGSSFSLSGTSINNPQPSLVVGVVLRTEHPIQNTLAAEMTQSENTRFPPYLFSAMTLGQCDIRENDTFKLETNPYVFFARRVTDFDDVHVSIDGSNGHFGRSHGAEGLTHIPMREIPIQPLTSLAQLQHAGLGHYSIKHDFNPQTAQEISSVWDGPNTMKLKPWHLRSHPNVNMAFANSFASPFVPQGSVEVNGISPLGGGLGGPKDFDVKLHDKSWKLNESLWDDWYMSGIGDWTNPLVSVQRDRDAVIREFVNDSKPLPNKRYGANVSNYGTALSELNSAVGYKKLAQYITSKGAFNVNSTSKGCDFF